MSSPASPSISLTAAERTRLEGSHCPLPRTFLPCLQSCFSTFLPSLLRFKFCTDSRMRFKSLTLERGPAHSDTLTQLPPRDTPSPGATNQSRECIWCLRFSLPQHILSSTHPLWGLSPSHSFQESPTPSSDINLPPPKTQSHVPKPPRRPPSLPIKISLSFPVHARGCCPAVRHLITRGLASVYLSHSLDRVPGRQEC